MTHGRNKKNFEIFSALDYIAAITQHIPEQSFQLVRYYGWYSNRMRGDRKKLEQEVGEGRGRWSWRHRNYRDCRIPAHADSITDVAGMHQEGMGGVFQETTST